jgi:hypothetical protein
VYLCAVDGVQHGDQRKSSHQEPDAKQAARSHQLQKWRHMCVAERQGAVRAPRGAKGLPRHLAMSSMCVNGSSIMAMVISPSPLSLGAPCHSAHAQHAQLYTSGVVVTDDMDKATSQQLFANS